MTEAAVAGCRLGQSCCHMDISDVLGLGALRSASSQAELAKTAGVSLRQLARYEAGDPATRPLRGRRPG